MKIIHKPFLLLLFVMTASILTGCGLDSPNNQIGNTTTKAAATSTAVPGPSFEARITATATPATQSALNTQVTETQPTPAPAVPVNVNWNANPNTEYTLSWTNVRSAPATSSSIVKREAPATLVTIYGSTTGEQFGTGSTWYRVSSQNDTPQYLYSGLVVMNKPAPAATPTPATATTAVPTTPAPVEKVIKISLTTQHAYAYENGTLVHDDLITSGRPELTTPTGTFKIFFKERNATFYPNPAWKGTPLDFSPEHINYALEFYDTGVFIHDATWRAAGDFGPGTENPHTAPDGTQATGSHGCINTTLADAAWYYNWAPIGTTVIVTP